LPIHRLHQQPAFLQLPDAVEADGVEALEDVAVLAVLRRAALLVDEALDLLEAGDDPLLARGPASRLLTSASTPSSARSASSSSVNLDIRRLRPRPLEEATPSAIRFSQASDEVIDGRRPRSILKRSARFARSRASSIVIVTFFAPITAATCFRLSSLIALARIA
jgi:hypothetical protein